MSIELDKATLKIKLIPRSARNEIVELMGDGTLKIKLTAPPVEGQANQAVLKFLAGILNIPNGSIEIISGKTSHNKMIAIVGLEQDNVKLLIQNQISK